MGNCLQKNCSKCGMPAPKNLTKSCRYHEEQNYNEVCVRCLTNRGNCYHKF